MALLSSRLLFQQLWNVEKDETKLLFARWGVIRLPSALCMLWVRVFKLYQIPDFKAHVCHFPACASQCPWEVKVNNLYSHHSLQLIS